MAFYDDMQTVASGLLEEFKQGAVTLTRYTEDPPPTDEPWKPGEKTLTVYSLSAAVRRVQQKYIDGSLIVATDDQITFAVPPVEPQMTDVFTVDGAVRVLKDLRRIPAAGTAVAYIAFVAG